MQLHRDKPILRPKSKALTSVLVFIAIFLAGAGCWAYLYGVLDPYWKAQRPGSVTNGYHSDFYPAWLATRMILKEHADPYSVSVTREIQRGIYGHALGADEPKDPQAFVYPAHLALLLVPFAMLPFPVASAIFSLVLLAMAALLMPLFNLALELGWSRRSQWIAAAVLLGSFPLAEALYVRQIAILALFFIAMGFAALRKNHPILAGLFFAFSTIKPQCAIVILAWLLFWCLTQWRARRRLLISWLGTIVLLLITTELLVPGWLKKWYAAAGAYLRYRDLKIPAAWLLPGPFAQVATVALLTGAAVLLWRWRNVEADDDRFGYAMALSLAATLVLIPTWPSHQYNQILLLPAVLLIIQRWPAALSHQQRTFSFLALAALAFSSLGALLVAAAALLLRMPTSQMGHFVEAPLFNFAIAPLITVMASIGLLWNAAPIELQPTSAHR